MTPTAPLLSVRELTLRFGGILALDRLSFDLVEGEILGLIGPNGSGKTSVLNCLSRIYRPEAGSILLGGEDLLALPAHRIAGRGLARTFQNGALFDRMSVADNLLAGAHSQRGLARGGLASRLDAVLGRLAIAGVARRRPGDLPTGIRRRVELARALMSAPRILLLDEPAAGLSHAEIADLAGLIEGIRADGVSVLLIEHHLALVRDICDRAIALALGRKVAEGKAAAVIAHPSVSPVARTGRIR